MFVYCYLITITIIAITTIVTSNNGTTVDVPPFSTNASVPSPSNQTRLICETCIEYDETYHHCKHRTYYYCSYNATENYIKIYNSPEYELNKPQHIRKTIDNTDTEETDEVLQVLPEDVVIAGFAPILMTLICSIIMCIYYLTYDTRPNRKQPHTYFMFCDMV
jgi:hypothetical protein